MYSINYMKTQNQYYCLVSSLPMDVVDAPASKDDVVEVLLQTKNEILEELTADDKKLAQLIDCQFDLINIFNVLDNNELPFNQLANLTPDQVGLEIEKPEVLGEPFVSLLPAKLEWELARFTGKIDEETEFEPIKTCKELQTSMMDIYYGLLEGSSSKMLNNWAKISLILGNVVVAYDARDNDDNIEYIVGASREVVALIKENYKANDFGLINEVDYAEGIVAVVSIKNIVEREKKLDELKLGLLDMLVEQEYFSTDYVLACIIKLNMKSRWAMLNESADVAKFKNMVKSFTDKLDLQDNDQNQEKNEK